MRFERNTLQTSIRSQQIALENLTAAESEIRDTDFAEETARPSPARRSSSTPARPPWHWRTIPPRTSCRCSDKSERRLVSCGFGVLSCLKRAARVSRQFVFSYSCLAHRPSINRPSPPSTDPSPLLDPPDEGACAMMRSASLLNGRLCSQTLPWPLSVARNNPSPPKKHALESRLHAGCHTSPSVQMPRDKPVSTRKRLASKLTFNERATCVDARQAVPRAIAEE